MRTVKTKVKVKVKTQVTNNSKWNYVTNKEGSQYNNFVKKKHQDSICEIWQDAVDAVDQLDSTLLS